MFAPAMRLAVEVSTCSADRTGIGYYTEHFVDALLATRAVGDDLILINNGKPAPELYDRWRDHLRIGGVPVRSIWMQRDANRLLVESGADFAMFPNYIAPLNVVCPFVNVVHDLAIIRMPEFFNIGKRASQRPLLPLIVRRAAAVGTVSAASRRDIVELLGVPEHRVLMLPGAPHPACRVPLPAEVERVRRAYGLSRRYIVSVGTLEPRKNLPTLLRAFDRLRTQAETADLDLVVIGGRGWRDRELRAEIASRLASGRLHTLGYVPEGDLVALYGGAEVLAYPSHFEGFGLPVVEAMACGTPVVTTDVPALREVSGGAAVLVPLGDELALADAVADMVRDPEVRAAARAKGLARAKTFSWEASAEHLWRFARETVAARSHWVAGKGKANGKANGTFTGTPTGTSTTAGEIKVEVAGDDPKWSILATVVYADMFDAPISLEEVARTCLGAQLSPADVRERVSAPPLVDLLTLDGAGMLTLRGREELVALRDDGVRRTAELLARHHSGDGRAGSLPFVRCWRSPEGWRTRTREAATTSICSWSRRRGARTRRTRCCFWPARSRVAAGSCARTISSTRTTCASPTTTICSPRTRRSRWFRSLASKPSTPSSRATRRGFARSIPSYQPRPPGHDAAAVAPAAPRRAVFARRWATRSNGCCRSAGGFTSGGARPARPRRTWCSTPEIPEVAPVGPSPAGAADFRRTAARAP